MSNLYGKLPECEYCPAPEKCSTHDECDVCAYGDRVDNWCATCLTNKECKFEPIPTDQPLTDPT